MVQPTLICSSGAGDTERTLVEQTLECNGKVVSKPSPPRGCYTSFREERVNGSIFTLVRPLVSTSSTDANSIDRRRGYRKEDWAWAVEADDDGDDDQDGEKQQEQEPTQEVVQQLLDQYGTRLQEVVAEF